MRRAALLTVLMCANLLAAPATQPSAGELLGKLRPGHPRLIVLKEDLPAVQRLIQSNPDARQLHDDLRAAAEKILTDPPIVRRLIGPRLLAQSRLCVDRVYTLATIYRLDGDERFARRAEREMLAAADFSDWNPKHFLDTAEMAHALGVGYDWLYDVLSPDSRTRIRTALIEKALKPATDIYRKNGWWAAADMNWNQVCNGGITVAALAIADEQPAVTGYILEQAVRSIRRPTARLAPDGGWDEGPGYWHYAMSYSAYYLAAINSALGSDFGLHEMPGFAQTGRFRMHFIGPTERTFNYADAMDRVDDAPEMFYFARLFDQPLYAWHQRHFRQGTHALDLLWYDARGEQAGMPNIPTDAWFKNIDVVFLRSAWNDQQAWYVGFKGGNNQASHGHLDLGTFVLDALGKRWAVDLGPDDYDLPSYFGKQRWNYYRLRTEAHNTLEINHKNQEVKAKAPIVAFQSTPEAALAVADLSQAYAGSVDQAYRGVAMLARDCVLVQDEIQAKMPVDVTWAINTPAFVDIAGPEATLRLKGAQVRVRLLEPLDARWQFREVKVDPPQKQIKYIRKLMLQVHTRPGPTRLAVLFEPTTGATVPAAWRQVRPLQQWATLAAGPK